MKHYVAASAVCPFYTQEERQRIHCKGFCKGSTVLLAFSGKEGMNDYKNRHCCHIKGYSDCPIYIAAAKPFEEKRKQP